MDSRDARLVLREARSWHARGLLTAEALSVIEAEHAADAARDGRDAAEPAERPGLGLSILYALAGILLGAACVAVPVLLHVRDPDIGWWLLALGVSLLAAGLGLRAAKAPPGIVDAVFVGSLVPLTAMGEADGPLGRWLAPAGLAAAVAVTWLRRGSATVPVIASAAAFVACGILSHQWFNDGRSPLGGFAAVGEWLWLTLTLAQLAATLLLGRRFGLAWRLPVSALLCVGAVVPFVLVLDRALPSHPARFYELLVGAFELALLLAGLGLRERGVVLGAAIVVAGDAIVYAFDLNVLLGILVLLAVAVALVALATVLKRSRRPDARPERT